VPFLGAVPLTMDLRAASDAGQPVVARDPDGALGRSISISRAACAPNSRGWIDNACPFPLPQSTEVSAHESLSRRHRHRRRRRLWRRILLDDTWQTPSHSAFTTEGARVSDPGQNLMIGN
jgi:hypothetical protein